VRRGSCAGAKRGVWSGGPGTDAKMRARMHHGTHLPQVVLLALDRAQLYRVLRLRVARGVEPHTRVSESRGGAGGDLECPR
jgi:hypothetical protein